MNHLLVLPLLGLFFSRAGALFGYALLHCLFNTNGGPDAVYLAQIFFNKVLLAEYNSTVGKYVGYTEKVKEVVAYLNKDEAFLKQEEKNTEKCRAWPKVFDTLQAAVEPNVVVRAEPASDGKHVVVCSAYSFYPKAIALTWRRDGQNVTSGVLQTDVLPNGNWLYQVHSYLEYTPTAGERIACVVQHASFSEPTLYRWDPVPESVMNKVAVGLAGLLMGLVFFIAGLIYYKKNANGHELVPTVPPSSDCTSPTTTPAT